MFCDAKKIDNEKTILTSKEVLFVIITYYYEPKCRNPSATLPQLFAWNLSQQRIKIVRYNYESS